MYNYVTTNAMLHKLKILDTFATSASTILHLWHTLIPMDTSCREKWHKHKRSLSFETVISSSDHCSVFLLQRQHLELHFLYQNTVCSKISCLHSYSLKGKKQPLDRITFLFRFQSAFLWLITNSQKSQLLQNLNAIQSLDGSRGVQRQRGSLRLPTEDDRTYIYYSHLSKQSALKSCCVRLCSAAFGLENNPTESGTASNRAEVAKTRAGNGR